MQKRGKKILIQKYCTVRIETVLKIVEFKWLFVEYPNALKICMVLVTLNICLHAALAPHYYPSNIFKIEISCFIGLYTNASTNGHTEKLNSKKKYEQMNVCLHANSRDKGICFLLKKCVCVFAIGFVSFLCKFRCFSFIFGNHLFAGWQSRYLCYLTICFA